MSAKVASGDKEAATVVANDPNDLKGELKLRFDDGAPPPMPACYAPLAASQTGAPGDWPWGAPGCKARAWGSSCDRA